LNDGFQVSNGTPSVSGPGSIPTTGKTLPPPVISAAPTVTNSLQTEKPVPQIETETDKQRPANISTMSKQQPPSQQTFAPAQMQTLERSLSGFYQHQN
jgi:hypothetical protein